MLDVIKQLGNDYIELTYDLYPSDRRPKMTGWDAVDRRLARIMSNDGPQAGHDRRCLTYDYYPGNRRKNRR